MTNLFSAFDPATSIKMSLNWLSTFIVILIVPSHYWLLKNRISMVTSTLIMKLYMEFKNIIGQSKGLTLLPISIFIFIMINNMFGIMPYIFTSTSHMSCTFAMALPMWVSFMLFGWINNYNKMFEHMIPVGTPPILMPFMVVIESVSNLIRPGSLSVRLFANMVAGHLLMSMLGSCANNYSIILPLIIMLQLTLTFFETAVAVVQAYVFSVLAVLYSSEVAFVKK